MQSLRSVFIVKGRPAIYAETMRGLALAAGHEIVYERQDGSTCTVRGRRDGQQSWHTVTWTLDMAKHAGLTRNPLYGTRPRAMLTARATSELCRDLFADVIADFVAVEDLDGQPEDAVPVAETSPARLGQSEGDALLSASWTLPARQTRCRGESLTPHRWTRRLPPSWTVPRHRLIGKEQGSLSDALDVSARRFPTTRRRGPVPCTSPAAACAAGR